MEKYIQAIFDLKKIPSLFCLVIVMAGTFFFYFPEYIVIEIDKKSNIYIYGYISYLISVPIVLISFIKFLYDKIKYLYCYYSVRRGIKKIILALNMNEKSVLREFYIQGQYSLEMPYNDSTVSGLIEKRILINTSPFNGAMLLSGDNSTYKIGDYSRKIIKPIEHLGFIPADATDEEQYKQLDSRPHWGRPLYFKQD